MKTKASFILILILSTLCVKTFSQAYNPSVKRINKDLRVLFSELDIPNNNYPFAEAFYDQVAHQTDFDWWKPFSQDTINLYQWTTLYQELYTSLYDTNNLEKINIFYPPTQKFLYDTFAVGLIGYHFQKFKDDALNSANYFIIDSTTGKLFDNYKIEITDTSTGSWVINPNSTNPKYYQNPDSLSPYSKEFIFSLTCFKTQFLYDSLVYRIDPSFLIFDTEIIDKLNNGMILQFDFNDGNGWQTISHNSISHHSIKYPAPSEITIQARLYNEEDEIEYSRSNTKLKSEKSSAQKPILPDFEISVGEINAGFYPPCSNSLQANENKFILFVEGLDVGNNNGPKEIYTRHINNTGLSELRNFGYTFITIDFSKPKESMKHNALQLVDFINHLKCNYLPQSADNTFPFVVMGKSQGGIIIRYALSYMENVNAGLCRPELMHNTRLMISIDSPHQGALYPLSIQHFLGKAGSFISGLSLPFAVGYDFAQTLIGLDSKGFKESSIYHIGNDYNFTAKAQDILNGNFSFNNNPFLNNSYSHNALRTSFLNDLNNVGGYPQFAKKMAISDGLFTGEHNPNFDFTGEMQPGDLLVGLNHESSVTVLGLKINISSADINFNAAGNYSNDLVFQAELGVKFWKPKIKMCKVFKKPFTFNLFGKKRTFNLNVNYPCGIKIIYDYVISVNSNEKTNNALPFEVMPGGVLSIESQRGMIGRYLYLPFQFARQENDFTDLVGKKGFTWFDIDLGITTINSRGLNFNITPVKSAIDFDQLSTPLAPLDLDIYSMPQGQIQQHTPFDVVYGQLSTPNYPDPSAYYEPSTFNLRDRFEPGINGDHFDWQNLKLINPTSNNRPGFIVNREIGDDDFYLDNQILNTTYNYMAYQNVVAGTKTNPFYEYPSQNFSQKLEWINNIPLPINYSSNGIYSKENPFEVSHPSPPNQALIQYGTSFTDNGIIGNYSTYQHNLSPCSENYIEGIDIKFFKSSIVGVNNIKNIKPNISLFPNPSLANAVLQIENPIEDLSVEVFGIDGSLVNKQFLKKADGFYQLTLNNFQPGFYLVKVSGATVTETLKWNKL